MNPSEALQAATINAADLLGLSDQIGSIEAGKLADIVAVDGEPLADIGSKVKVVFVMKSGEIIKKRSMSLKIHSKEKRTEAARSQRILPS